MHLFYAPDIQDDCYSLNAEDSRHCVKVLRLKAGERITLTDGAGNLYYAVIQKADSKETEVVVERKEHVGKPWSFSLHIAIAPTKNMNRTEWALEKITEMGVDKITPLLCEHSERKVVKFERMNRIITAAVKQSLKAYYPELSEMTSLEDFVAHSFSGQKKYIAYIDEQYREHLADLYEPGSDAVILIGPEGDFSKDEVKMAVEKGFQPVSLGKSRLRTETAAVAACHSFHLLNQKTNDVK